MKATAKDLRFHTRELLETVKRGEEVIITYRGKPSAKMVPCTSSKAARSDNDGLFGMWRDRDDIEDVATHVRTLRKGRF